MIHNENTPATATVAKFDPWRTHTAVIRDITAEVPGVATYDLAFQDSQVASDYRFAPGQFNMVYLPGAGEIPISLSADPHSSETWAHTIRVIGNVTWTLASLKPSETIGLRGPFGNGWPIDQCRGRDVIFVAGGIGLAPLRPAIYQLLHNREQYGKLNLLYGARSPDTILFTRQYEDWDDQGLLIKSTVDRAAPGWLRNVGVVTVLLERLRTFDPDNTVLLCCGPEVMMKYTAMTALKRGIDASRIWISTERNMQCAIGHCGHCQLGPEFICKDGPVFRYDRIADLLDVEGL
jgi:NAD(P)H-flavin reductase